MNYFIEKSREKYRKIRDLLPVIYAAEIKVRSIRNNPLLFPQRRYLDIKLDTNNVCNLSCGFCNIDLIRRNNPQPPSFLSLDGFKKIAGEMFLNAMSVYLSCRREPFMTKNFIEYIKIANNYKVPQIGFVSNGTLIREKDVEVCVAEGLHIVNISIDGATSETYRTIRGAELEKTINALRLFKEYKVKYNVNLPKVTVNFTVFDINAHELPLFIKKYGELFDCIRIGHYIKRFGHLPFNRVSDNLYEKITSEAASLCEAKGIEFNSGYEKKMIDKVKRCTVPLYYRNIDCEGNVTLCSGQLMGNILKEDYRTIEKKSFHTIIGLTKMNNDYCKNKCY